MTAETISRAPDVATFEKQHTLAYLGRLADITRGAA